MQKEIFLAMCIHSSVADASASFVLAGKTLNKQVMAAVEAALQQRFGSHAGWAHNTLFIAELAMHRDLLPAQLQAGGGRSKSGFKAGTSSARTGPGALDGDQNVVANVVIADTVGVLTVPEAIVKDAVVDSTMRSGRRGRAAKPPEPQSPELVQKAAEADSPPKLKRRAERASTAGEGNVAAPGVSNQRESLLTPNLDWAAADAELNREAAAVAAEQPITATADAAHHCKSGLGSEPVKVLDFPPMAVKAEGAVNVRSARSRAARAGRVGGISDWKRRKAGSAAAAIAPHAKNIPTVFS